MKAMKFDRDELVKEWMLRIDDSDSGDLELLEAIADAISYAYHQGVQDGSQN